MNTKYIDFQCALTEPHIAHTLKAQNAPSYLLCAGIPSTFDLEAEIDNALCRMQARVDRDVRAAQRRIAEPTPTELARTGETLRQWRMRKTREDLEKLLANIGGAFERIGKAAAQIGKAHAGSLAAIVDHMNGGKKRS